jgi:Protein of unknown function (DUF3261)
MTKWELANDNLGFMCLWLICLCLFSACQFAPKKFPLLSVTSDGQAVAAQQQWLYTHANEHFALQVVVERSADHWHWVMMNNLGQRIATASSKNGVISIEQQQSHPALQMLPELLEALQWSYWPIDDLRKNGLPLWRIEQSVNHREIFFSDILQAVITYPLLADDTHENLWQGKLYYENKKKHFQLTIQSQLLD